MTEQVKHTQDSELALVDDNLVYGLNAEAYNAWTASVWDEGGARRALAHEIARRWNAHLNLLAALEGAERFLSVLVNDHVNGYGANALQNARAVIRKAYGEE